MRILYRNILLESANFMTNVLITLAKSKPAIWNACDFKNSLLAREKKMLLKKKET